MIAGRSPFRRFRFRFVELRGGHNFVVLDGGRVEGHIHEIAGRFVLHGAHRHRFHVKRRRCCGRRFGPLPASRVNGRGAHITWPATEVCKRDLVGQKHQKLFAKRETSPAPKLNLP